MAIKTIRRIDNRSSIGITIGSNKITVLEIKQKINEQSVLHFNQEDEEIMIDYIFYNEENKALDVSPIKSILIIKKTEKASIIKLMKDYLRSQYDESYNKIENQCSSFAMHVAKQTKEILNLWNKKEFIGKYNISWIIIYFIG